MKSEPPPSAKRLAAKRDYLSVKSTTDWAWLSSGSAGTETPENPEADVHHTVPGIFCHGLTSQSAR